MKKLSLLLILLLLCGCAKADPPAPAPEYGAPDVSGTHFLLIETPVGLVPLAVAENGRSQLSGDNYYYNLTGLYDDTAPLTAFSPLGENIGAYRAGEPYSQLMTTGNWRLCPDVRAVKPDGDAARFASSVVSDAQADAVYETDLDGDGAGEQFILARSGGKTHLIVRSTTLGDKLIASSDGAVLPFFADTDGDGSFCLITVTGGSLKKATVCLPESLAPDYTVYLPLE